MSTHTIEWAPFRIKPGINEAQLLAASMELQHGFLAEQNGFLRRELISDGNGGYTDVVWWASHEAAEQAMQHAARSDACHRYFTLMQDADHEQPGQGVSHFVSVAVYGKEDHV